eukprot:9218512-Karenia_brevis.AAC.1
MPVTEHAWRIKFWSADVLLNYFRKVMGPESFTKKDADDSTQRHAAKDLMMYSIPRFILKHPMG